MKNSRHHNILIIPDQISESKKSIPDEIHISIFEIFIYIWGIITFFGDLISDVILSIEYFNNSETWLAFLTLIFVILPNASLSIYDFSWSIDKYYREKNSNNKSTIDLVIFWIKAIFIFVFQLHLVSKYINAAIYTFKGWLAYKNKWKEWEKWEEYYIKKQIQCETNIGMLILIDVFMDSGPQVLLQLYVITTQNLNETGSGNLVVFTFKDFKTTSLELKQFFSIFSSLFSMSYALAGYYRCLRNQQFIRLDQGKPLHRPMRWLSTVIQFIWYLFLIAPRVLSMALFATTFRSWFVMIIFTHWLIMYCWILRLKTNYCITYQDGYSAREEIFEKLYDFVWSFIYIFAYFDLKSGQTRLRYLIYYIVFYCENLVFCSCYFVFTKETNFAYKLVMLFIVVLGFWIAITFQIIFYLNFHPAHKFSVSIRKSNKFCIISKERPKSNVCDVEDNYCYFQVSENNILD